MQVYNEHADTKIHAEEIGILIVDRYVYPEQLKTSNPKMTLLRKVEE